MVRKWFRSEILKKRLHLFVTHKADRTMKKHGGLDNYILNMSKDKLCSDFADTLKGLMKAKLSDPSMVVPYIPRTSTVRSRKFKKDVNNPYSPIDRNRNLPSVYMTVEDQLKDRTPYVVKSLQDMSRHEKKLIDWEQRVFFPRDV